MDNSTTQTFEKYSSPTRFERFEKDDEKYPARLAVKIGAGALALAAVAGGVKGIMEIPTDRDMSSTPEDTSISQVTAIEGAQVRANPGINEMPDDPNSNVIGSVENKSDTTDDAITLATPDGVRIYKNVVNGQESVFYGFDIDELKEAGIDITGKDHDGIGWIQESQITDVVQNEATEP